MLSLLPIIPGPFLVFFVIRAYSVYYKNGGLEKKHTTPIIVSVFVMLFCLLLWGVLRNFYPPFFV